MAQLLESALAGASEATTSTSRESSLRRALQLLDAAQELGLGLDPARAQVLLYEGLLVRTTEDPDLARNSRLHELARRLGFAETATS